MKIYKYVLFFLMTVMVSAHAYSLIDAQQQELRTQEALWYSSAKMQSPRSSGALNTELTARHVDFIFTSGIGFYIENLTASFVPIHSWEPVNLDDPTQFIIRVHSGQIIIPPQSLSALFNFQILDYWPRPLNNIVISTGRNYLGVQAGLRLWSWVPPIFWVPASLGGTVYLNQQKLVYTPYDVRALGIPLAGFFNSLGIRLSGLMTLNREGAVLLGNSLVLDPTKVFPPPAIEGTITSVCLDESGLHLTFNDNSMPVSAPAGAPDSFIWIRSGDVKLFDMVVLNANVLIRSENKNVLFDLYHYRSEIAAHNRVNMQEDGSIVLTL